MNDLKLTEDELIDACTAYAFGKSTTQVIDAVIESRRLEKNDRETREAIRQQLRSADPRSRRFARSKYGLTYDLAREAARDEITARVKPVIQYAFDRTIERLESLNRLDEKVVRLLENADTLSVNTTGEFIQLLREFSRIQTTRLESINALVELSDRLTEKSPDLEETWKTDSQGQTVDALLKLVALYQEIGGNDDDFIQAILPQAIEILLDAIAE